MDILVLDFDGVICDSASETARSGWFAGSVLWPVWAKQDIPDQYLKQFRKLRPLLHTGFEAVAILKFIEEDYSVPFVRANYNFLMRQVFTSSQYNFDELKLLFDRVRDDWIRIDEAGWLSWHRFYPGISSFLIRAQEKFDSVYIITTKQGRFVSKLLKYGEMDFPDDKIIGLETGKTKNENLKEIMDLCRSEKDRVIFLDDRYLTLEKVKKEKELDRISLYMPGWGYSFIDERDNAESDGRIKLLELEDLETLLV